MPEAPKPQSKEDAAAVKDILKQVNELPQKGSEKHEKATELAKKAPDSPSAEQRAKDLEALTIKTLDDLDAKKGQEALKNAVADAKKTIAQGEPGSDDFNKPSPTAPTTPVANRDQGSPAKEI